MGHERKTLIILLFLLLIFISQRSLESQTEELNVRKIIPQPAAIALTWLYHEGDTGIRYRVLLEFQGKTTISDAEKGTLWNSLFFKNFCIADVAVRDIFQWANNKTIHQIYVLNQANSDDISKPGNKQTVIGIIDRGCDWKNKCFMKGESNESRIAYLWDQTLKESQPGNIDIPYGVEFRKQDIQASINSQCNLIPVEAGHGWIIAAIAAGNVIIRDEQNNELFPGKSLDLPLIMVNTTGKMDALVDAIAYITRKARQMKSRCVINFAYCKHTGPHEPGDMYLRAIDALLDERSILVVAAGNEGMKKIYTRKEMQPSARLEFEINKSRYAAEKTGAHCRVEIEAWYGGQPMDNISLISPLGKVYGAVGKGEHSSFNSPDGIIFISNSASTPAELKRQGVFVSITSDNGQAPQDGQWALVFEKAGISCKNFIEAWITKSEKCDTQFKNEGQLLNTISFLAFSKKAVSVGAWIHNGDIIKEADFSNNPCKTVNCPSPMPSVLAAGRVTVAIPGFSEPLSQEGSSVSTALITRFIAETWSDNPGLNAADFKKNLEGKALTFNAGKYRWNGLAIYRLVEKENSLAIGSGLKQKVTQ